MLSREGVINRLNGYWQMEAANVFLVPAAMIGTTYYQESTLGWLSVFAIVPMCALLVIGAAYWRGKLIQLKGDGGALDRMLAWAHRLDLPLAVLSVIALLLTLVSWVVPSLSVSLADRVVATIAASLAVLEYVNYYHRQLQHFDHLADFKRFLSGRGFRRAQMAVDLERFRRNR